MAIAKNMGSGWHSQSVRHSYARRFGRADGKNLTKTQEKTLKTKIKENKQIPLTHPRKIGKNKGLYYLKAGNIHKVDVKKDLNIKAQHKRSPKEDSWRGDNKPSTFQQKTYKHKTNNKIRVAGEGITLRLRQEETISFFLNDRIFSPEQFLEPKKSILKIFLSKSYLFSKIRHQKALYTQTTSPK